LVVDDCRRLPAETLSPLAERVDEALALYGYELTPVIDAIDAAVPGFGGLLDPATADSEIRSAVADVIDAGPPSTAHSCDGADATDLVLYVDGSSRGNPGPAGAGAVIQAEGTTLARLGRPVGSKTGNNIAEHAALHLGLEAIVTWFGSVPVEVRIDSMTTINNIWGEDSKGGSYETYSAAIQDHLATVDAHEWTHLVDSDPNPADARAAVGADIAALGPG